MTALPVVPAASAVVSTASSTAWAGVAAILQEAAPDGGGGALTGLLQRVEPATALRALLMVVVGVPIVYAATRATRAWVSGRVNAQAGLVSGKLVLYIEMTIVVISTLRELGFSLAPLLGAAGVLGIALGFASQTSVSNVISGLFLIAERPFVIGDLIDVGGVIGRVASIDTLSVQLRTFDNRMVRIPNETLVKSQMVNITRYPIRRVDVRVGVAYREDPRRVRELLLDIARRNPTCLMEPEPVVVAEGFGESSINFLFGVWTTQQNFLKLRNSIHEDIKTRFDREGVEIPFPHRTLYVGSETGPFPLAMEGGGTGGPEASDGGGPEPPEDSVSPPGPGSGP